MKKEITRERGLEIRGILEDAWNKVRDSIAKELPKNDNYIELNDDFGYTILSDDPDQVSENGVPRTIYLNTIINKNGDIKINGVFEDDYVDFEDGLEDFEMGLNDCSLNVLYHLVRLLSCTGRTITIVK